MGANLKSILQLKAFHLTWCVCVTPAAPPAAELGKLVCRYLAPGEKQTEAPLALRSGGALPRERVTRVPPAVQSWGSGMGMSAGRQAADQPGRESHIAAHACLHAPAAERLLLSQAGLCILNFFCLVWSHLPAEALDELWSLLGRHQAGDAEASHRLLFLLRVLECWLTHRGRPQVWRREQCCGACGRQGMAVAGSPVMKRDEPLAFLLPLCLQPEVLVRLRRPLGWQPPPLPSVSGVEIVSQGAAGSDKPEPSFSAGAAGGDAAGAAKGFVPQGAPRPACGSRWLWAARACTPPQMSPPCVAACRRRDPGRASSERR